jgi:pilus assembly protein CpaF
VEEIGVVRRDGDWVAVEPGWRADGGPCPGADRLAALLDGGAAG